MGVGDAPGVGGRHHHVAGGQPLRRLRSRLPPLDVGLELAQLGEGTVGTGAGRQQRIDLLAWHAVGEQGELQVVDRPLAQAALAGEALDVPEVGPGGRRLLQPVGVVADRHAPDQRGGTAFLGGIGDQLLLAADGLPVQTLEQAVVATARQIRPLDLDQVPVGVTGVGHHLDPGHLAVVLALHYGNPGLLRERLEERHLLGLLSGAAVADHHQAIIGLDRRRPPNASRTAPSRTRQGKTGCGRALAARRNGKERFMCVSSCSCCGVDRSEPPGSGHGTETIQSILKNKLIFTDGKFISCF